MSEGLRAAALSFNAAVLGYFLAVTGAYLFLLLLSAVEMRRYLRQLRYGGYDVIFRDPGTPSVAVLMPSFNEEVNIAVSVRGMLNLNYPSFEVIVISDGSTDRTLEVLKEAFRLVVSERARETGLQTRPVRGVYRSLEHPNLLVIDKDNGGKADSLNAGINACRSAYFCAVDADVILEQDALLHVMRPVVEDPARVVAVGGIVRVANGCRVESARVAQARLPAEALPMLQVVEYLRAFLGGRTGFSRLNGLLIISGAFGLFAKKWAVAAGGYRTETVGEDMDLVCAMHGLLREMGVAYRIAFIADPVCWTEVPADFAVLGRQRRRWQRGLLEALWRHRGMLLRPRFGLVGCFSMPFFWAFEAVGPVVEAAGYLSLAATWACGWLDPSFAVAFATLAVLSGMVLTLSSILMEDLSFRRYPRWSEAARLLVYGVLENVGYRQLTVYYRCLGVVDFLRGARGWGRMERRGLGT